MSPSRGITFWIRNLTFNSKLEVSHFFWKSSLRDFKSKFDWAENDDYDGDDIYDAGHCDSAVVGDDADDVDDVIGDCSNGGHGGGDEMMTMILMTTMETMDLSMNHMFSWKNMSLQFIMSHWNSSCLIQAVSWDWPHIPWNSNVRSKILARTPYPQATETSNACNLWHQHFATKSARSELFPKAQSLSPLPFCQVQR